MRADLPQGRAKLLSRKADRSRTVACQSRKRQHDQTTRLSPAGLDLRRPRHHRRAAALDAHDRVPVDRGLGLFPQFPAMAPMAPGTCSVRSSDSRLGGAPCHARTCQTDRLDCVGHILVGNGPGVRPILARFTGRRCLYRGSSPLHCPHPRPRDSASRTPFQGSLSHAMPRLNS